MQNKKILPINLLTVVFKLYRQSVHSIEHRVQMLFGGGFKSELFLNISKSFNCYHFIVIDDLERMNDDIKLEEVFGIIDELKRCNYVKVILVTNTKEMPQKERFEKYHEKVIDRTYYITERPEKVDWAKLGIHYGFIIEFLSKHHVKKFANTTKSTEFI